MARGRTAPSGWQWASEGTTARAARASAFGVAGLVLVAGLVVGGCGHTPVQPQGCAGRIVVENGPTYSNPLLHPSGQFLFVGHVPLTGFWLDSTDCHLYAQVDDDSAGTWTVGMQGQPERLLALPNGSDARFSHDGRWIAFSTHVNGEQICRMQVAGDSVVPGTLVQLTFDGNGNLWPAWSPNDSLIVYTVLEGPGAGIYIIRATDGWEVGRVGGYMWKQPDWSPDGSRIACIGKARGDSVWGLVVTD
ncbi:MAG TPA: hypothetical protein VMS93_01365, partial [Candidatus Saccharimonadales bacterium]|nr:hypothetical protein [Candidatus Saccharimonadales bacterium]